MADAGLRTRLSLTGHQQFIAGMGAASGSLARLRQSANLTRVGVRQVGQGFSGLRTAALALAGTGGATIKKFKDFDAQMAAVRAVLGEAQKKSFPALEAKAKQLGATTSFTAKQAAEAMENLARAGLKPNQILGAIGPVLQAAAAEGMSLGTAADIVASNMRAFGLSADDAQRIAGKLALVSARTNTNMISLQEGMKFVAPVARSLKIPLGDAAASLGLLANVGIKGSLAGTALKNALLKISKASKDGTVKVGKTAVAIAKANNGGVDLKNTMIAIVGALQNIKDPLKRQNAAMKLLGLRGLGAATAFDAIKKADADKLFRNVAQEQGESVKAMAKMRLASFTGLWVKMSSAIDGAAIAVGRELAGAITPMIGTITKFASGIAKGNTFVTKFAQGVKAGIGDAKVVFSDMFGTLRGALGIFTTAQGGMKDFIRTALRIGAIVIKWKVYLGLLDRTKNILMGIGKITKGVLGVTKHGLAGVLKVIGKRIPAVQKVLPKALGRLTGAVTGLEKITAQPVRVVNFDEAGIGGAAAGGLGETARNLPGLLAGARAGLAGFVGRFGKSGAFLNSTLTQMTMASGSLTKKLLGSAGLVAAAGGAGFALGTLIDKTFGLSDKFSNLAHSTLKARLEQDASVARARAARETLMQATDAQRTLNQLLALRKKGIKTVRVEGRAVSITRQLAEKRVTESLKRSKLTQDQIKAVLTIIKPTLEALPNAVKTGVENAKINANVNTSDVQKGVAAKNQESDARAGRNKSGARAAAARGATR
jgi:TP901 family phage tail tape measure protein